MYTRLLLPYIGADRDHGVSRWIVLSPGSHCSDQVSSRDIRRRFKPGEPHRLHRLPARAVLRYEWIASAIGELLGGVFLFREVVLPTSARRNVWRYLSEGMRGCLMYRSPSAADTFYVLMNSFSFLRVSAFFYVRRDTTARTGRAHRLLVVKANTNRCSERHPRMRVSIVLQVAIVPDRGTELRTAFAIRDTTVPFLRWFRIRRMQ